MKSNLGKVLITNPVHQHLVHGLNEAGYAVSYHPEYDPRDLEAVLPELTGIIINTKIKMTADRIKIAKKLKFIGRLGSGLDIIDLKAAADHGVSVFNSPEGNRNAVAEHALGMLLCLINNISRGDHQVRKRLWNREQNRGMELEGKTIGLIGMGNTGQALARLLSPWTLRVIYSDPNVLTPPENLPNITSASIHQLRKEADIISLHVQLTDETRGMVDHGFLQKCKKGLILINTSRGAVVQTSGLLKALEDEQVSGACLDVYENEKPHSFNKTEESLYDHLYARDDVILTPHVAGWTTESFFKIAKVLLEKITRVEH